VPVAVGRRRGPEPFTAVGGRSGHGTGPREARELARGGDGRHVVGLAARAEAPVGAVRAALGAPADLQDVVGLAAQGGPSSCRTLDWN
jgi:hypothetical protein